VDLAEVGLDGEGVGDPRLGGIRWYRIRGGVWVFVFEEEGVAVPIVGTKGGRSREGG